MDSDTYYVYNLIKISVCKYITTPLKCSKEDIIQLSIEILLLVNNNNYDYKEWYQLFNKYLNILSYGELNNLICYVKNHILSKK